MLNKMNEEIKKIRDYIKCPQFGDNHYGKWGALNLEQRIKIKKMLDYITNLQEKNQKLNKIIDELGKEMNRDDLSYIETQFVIDKLTELKKEVE